MLDDALNKCADNNNYTIYTSMCKAQRILMRSYDAVCSISGGSDSDIVLDMIHKADEDGKVRYFWIDTGLEYQATKEHLDFLEQKYGIEIIRLKPDKPIPSCVKQFGVPFLSKYVSEQMMRLQAHHFQWEDEPLQLLLQKYPKCKTALQWWCGERYSDKGGIRSAAFKTCFSECKSKAVIHSVRSFGIPTATSVTMKKCSALRTHAAIPNTDCGERAVSAVLSASILLRSLQSLRNMSRCCIRRLSISSASPMNIQRNTVLSSRR